MKLTSRVPNWFRLGLRGLRSAPERQDLIWEWQRSRYGEPALPGGSIGRVMLFCHGNICRSPFAAAVLAMACSRIDVRSGGLEAREGDPAEPGAIRVGAEFGADLSSHTAHRLTTADVEWADLLLGMTGRHVASIEIRWPETAGKVQLLGDFLQAPPYLLEDPWGRPDVEFRSVFARISRASVRLAERL